MKSKKGVLTSSTIVWLFIGIVLMFLLTSFASRSIGDAGRGTKETLCSARVDLNNDGVADNLQNGICACDGEKAGDNFPKYYRVKSDIVGTNQWNGIFKSNLPSDIKLELSPDGLYLVTERDVNYLVTYLEGISVSNDGNADQDRWTLLQEDLTPRLVASLNINAPSNSVFCNDQSCFADNFKETFFEEIDGSVRSECKTFGDACQEKIDQWKKDNCEEK